MLDLTKAEAAALLCECKRMFCEYCLADNYNNCGKVTESAIEKLKAYIGEGEQMGAAIQCLECSLLGERCYGQALFYPEDCPASDDYLRPRLEGVELMTEIEITKDRAIERLEFIRRYELQPADKLSFATIKMAIGALCSQISLTKEEAVALLCWIDNKNNCDQLIFCSKCPLHAPCYEAEESPARDYFDSALSKLKAYIEKVGS